MEFAVVALRSWIYRIVLFTETNGTEVPCDVVAGYFAVFFPNILGVPRGMLQWRTQELSKSMVNSRTRKRFGQNQDNDYGVAWRAGTLLNIAQKQRNLTIVEFQRWR